TIWREPPDEIPSNDTLSTTARTGYYAYDDGDPVDAYVFYYPGDGYGVKFLKPAGSQHVIDSVYLWFWGDDWPVPGSDEAAYYIFDNDGTDGLPGTLLYADTVSIMRGTWNAFAPDTPITVEGSFYVFYLQTDTFPQCPGLGIDLKDDAPESTQWYLENGVFYSDEDPIYHSPGDLMIRVLECPVAVPLYTRGDANADGSVDISDVPYILGHLFPSPVFPCQRAADVDTSNSVDVTDVSKHLAGLFPSPSFPPPDSCGNAPWDSLPCDSFPPCGWNTSRIVAGVDNDLNVRLQVGLPERRDDGFYVIPVYVESSIPFAAYQVSFNVERGEVVGVSEEGCVSESFDYFNSYIGEGKVMFAGVVSLEPYMGGVAPHVEAGDYRIADIVVRGEDVELSPDMAVITNVYAQSVEPEILLGVGEGASRLPKVFALFQNIPNPFGGNTVIKYALPKDVDVELTIYNIAGQKVRTLVNGHEQAGYRTVKWDGRDDAGRRVAPGVYFYKLKAGKFEATKKLTLVR
ncbi:MAG: hypothetical protein DRN08_05680, partial [Thermoplasmata archaeon]